MSSDLTSMFKHGFIWELQAELTSSNLPLRELQDQLPFLGFERNQKETGDFRGPDIAFVGGYVEDQAPPKETLCQVPCKRGREAMPKNIDLFSLWFHLPRCHVACL